jgi:hypothetical protein
MKGRLLAGPLISMGFGVVVTQRFGGGSHEEVAGLIFG